MLVNGSANHGPLVPAVLRGPRSAGLLRRAQAALVPPAQCRPGCCTWAKGTERCHRSAVDTEPALMAFARKSAAAHPARTRSCCSAAQGTRHGHGLGHGPTRLPGPCPAGPGGGPAQPGPEAPGTGCPVTPGLAPRARAGPSGHALTPLGAAGAGLPSAPPHPSSLSSYLPQKSHGLL